MLLMTLRVPYWIDFLVNGSFSWMRRNQFIDVFTVNVWLAGCVNIDRIQPYSAL